ncbi:MAG: aldose epimerase family protein [Coraliomargarita sp.]
MKTEPNAISATSFGQLENGIEAKLYTLTNCNGLQVKVSDYGATLVAVIAPDRNGDMADVLHGYDSVRGYTGAKNPYFGASVGRFGNRIRDGKFSLGGVDYQLATNNEPGGVPSALHGGVDGFSRRLWRVSDASASSITFNYVSEDGEEGYPGTVEASVTYRLNDENELTWRAVATTDAATVINMVHHPYWNLSGDPSSSINDHILTLPCDRYLPTNSGLIPTGELAVVADTPMDFTQAAVVGDRLDQQFEALEFGGGYDHCWVLSHPDTEECALAARLEDPKSGRVMEIWTNQLAVQFYGGNFLAPADFQGEFEAGKNGHAYQFRTALCLETENFPDAPNQPDFPSSVLRPGEVYEHVMSYRFLVG